MKGKIVLTMVSGLLLLGAGCTVNTLTPSYNTQSYVPPQPQVQPVAKPQQVQVKEVVLARDTQYGFEFVTTPQCKNVFRVTQERLLDCDTLGVQDNIPTVGGNPECVRAGYYLELASPAVSNPKFFMGRRFAVISRWLYDRIDHEELPGTPKIHEALDNDLLLTSYDPNGDVFGEANSCEWKVRKITN